MIFDEALLSLLLDVALPSLLSGDDGIVVSVVGKGDTGSTMVSVTRSTNSSGTSGIFSNVGGVMSRGATKSTAGGAAA